MQSSTSLSNVVTFKLNVISTKLEQSFRFKFLTLCPPELLETVVVIDTKHGHLSIKIQHVIPCWYTWSSLCHTCVNRHDNLSSAVTFNQLIPLQLTFALVGRLVQNGLGGYDFPVPEKQWGLRSANVIKQCPGNNDLFTSNMGAVKLLKQFCIFLDLTHLNWVLDHDNYNSQDGSDAVTLNTITASDNKWCPYGKSLERGWDMNEK